MAEGVRDIYGLWQCVTLLDACRRVMLSFVQISCISPSVMMI